MKKGSAENTPTGICEGGECEEYDSNHVLERSVEGPVVGNIQYAGEECRGFNSRQYLQVRSVECMREIRNGPHGMKNTPLAPIY